MKCAASVDNKSKPATSERRRPASPYGYGRSERHIYAARVVNSRLGGEEIRFGHCKLPISYFGSFREFNTIFVGSGEKEIFENRPAALKQIKEHVEGKSKEFLKWVASDAGTIDYYSLPRPARMLLAFFAASFAREIGRRTEDYAKYRDAVELFYPLREASTEYWNKIVENTKSGVKIRNASRSKACAHFRKAGDEWCVNPELALNIAEEFVKCAFSGKKKITFEGQAAKFEIALTLPSAEPDKHEKVQIPAAIAEFPEVLAARRIIDNPGVPAGYTAFNAALDGLKSVEDNSTLAERLLQLSRIPNIEQLSQDENVTGDKWALIAGLCSRCGFAGLLGVLTAAFDSAHAAGRTLAIRDVCLSPFLESLLQLAKVDGVGSEMVGKVDSVVARGLLYTLIERNGSDRRPALRGTLLSITRTATTETAKWLKALLEKSFLWDEVAPRVADLSTISKLRDTAASDRVTAFEEKLRNALTLKQK